MSGARPVGAGVLTILGGLFILAGGATVALFGILVFAIFGAYSGLWLVGLLLGALTMLLGVLMMVVPVGHPVLGVLAIVFACLAVGFALAGFLVGTVLAVLGGIQAIRWRRPPPETIITVEARTLP